MHDLATQTLPCLECARLGKQYEIGIHINSECLFTSPGFHNMRLSRS
jgi:hypothetical protein